MLCTKKLQTFRRVNMHDFHRAYDKLNNKWENTGEMAAPRTGMGFYRLDPNTSLLLGGRQGPEEEGTDTVQVYTAEEESMRINETLVLPRGLLDPCVASGPGNNPVYVVGKTQKNDPGQKYAIMLFDKVCRASSCLSRRTRGQRTCRVVAVLLLFVGRFSNSCIFCASVKCGALKTFSFFQAHLGHCGKIQCLRRESERLRLL